MGRDAPVENHWLEGKLSNQLKWVIGTYLYSFYSTTHSSQCPWVQFSQHSLRTVLLLGDLRLSTFVVKTVVLFTRKQQIVRRNSTKF